MTRMAHYRDLVTDEQALANGYIEKVTFANGREAFMPSSPIEMESVGAVPTVPAPAIGADTERIMAELGYGPEDIQKLAAGGAVRTAE